MYVPVVPLKHNRRTPWEYDCVMYSDAMKSNDCSAGSKGFRYLFSRFEKLHVMFVAFINFALIVDGLH